MINNSTIPNSDAYNWVIGPATRCVLLAGEEVRISGLLHKSLASLAGQGPLLQVARNVIQKQGMDVSPFDRLLQQQPELTTWAKEILDQDLHDLHVNGVVALWSALEVAIEDTATLILLKDPSAIEVAEKAGVKLPKHSSSPLSESDARRIYGRFGQAIPKQPTVTEFYCEVLQILGIPVSLPNATHRKLSELNFVRNCILHRSGIADERVVRETPDLGISPGNSIRIGQAAYLQYFDAVAQFAIALVTAAIASRHVRYR